MEARRLCRVAGTTYGDRAAHIHTLLGRRDRRFVQCRLAHQPNNQHDEDAVSVIAREGGCDIGFLARGSLPRGQASLVDGRFARLEIGRCTTGAFVYARVLIAP